MEIKFAKMVATILLVSFLAWTPYTIMSIWAMFFDGNRISPIVALVPTLFTKVGAFANAFMYGLRYCGTLLIQIDLKT